MHELLFGGQNAEHEQKIKIDSFNMGRVLTGILHLITYFPPFLGGEGKCKVIGTNQFSISDFFYSFKYNFSV